MWVLLERACAINCRKGPIATLSDPISQQKRGSITDLCTRNTNHWIFFFARKCGLIVTAVRHALFFWPGIALAKIMFMIIGETGDLPFPAHVLLDTS
jgi:hypothetical protein